MSILGCGLYSYNWSSQSKPGQTPHSYMYIILYLYFFLCTSAIDTESLSYSTSAIGTEWLYRTLRTHLAESLHTVEVQMS